MFESLKSNRSLSSFMQTLCDLQSWSSTSHPVASGVTSVADTAFHTAHITSGYNTQLQGYLSDFAQKRVLDADRLDLSKPNTIARNRGVSRAWEYEVADIKMGGKGSSNWSKFQQSEIIKRGSVRGAEGHHLKNVADHPEHQANPDNIKFYKTKGAHLREGHNGDWHNESNAEFISKDDMLKKTNTRRIVENEMHGLGIAVLIGAGLGITIGVATELAQSGITPDSLKLAFMEGIKGGAESGILSGVAYGIGRTLGNVVSNAISGVMQNFGLAITDNISKMINMGVVGTLGIVVISAYQFVKLKRQGLATKEALLRIGKQALFSLSLLAVSIVSQGIWGGAAGIIVSVSIGIIIISYSVIDSVHNKRIAESIREYSIEKCYPAFQI